MGVIILKSEILEVLSGGEIHIPEDYILELGIGEKVICFLENGELVIRPFFEEIKEDSKDILEDLKARGFTGEELLNEYKKVRRQGQL